MFETTLTFKGIFRLNEYPINMSSVVLNKPPINKWFIEFFNIVIYGPQFTRLDLIIPPSSTKIELNIDFTDDIHVVSGYKNKKIIWTELKEGHHVMSKNDNNSLTLDIQSLQGNYGMIKKSFNGPNIVENILMETSITTDDYGWNTTEEPITKIKYTKNISQGDIRLL